MCDGRTWKHTNSTKFCHITKLQECVLEELGYTWVQHMNKKQSFAKLLNCKNV
jgi:hypothetical protein